MILDIFWSCFCLFVMQQNMQWLCILIYLLFFHSIYLFEGMTVIFIHTFFSLIYSNQSVFYDVLDIDFIIYKILIFALSVGVLS